VRLREFTEPIGEADKNIIASLEEHMWERIEMVWQKRRHVTRLSKFHGIWWGYWIAINLSDAHRKQNSYWWG
jgi:hypothetical protein